MKRELRKRERKNYKVLHQSGVTSSISEQTVTVEREIIDSIQTDEPSEALASIPLAESPTEFFTPSAQFQQVFTFDNIYILLVAPEPIAGPSRDVESSSLNAADIDAIQPREPVATGRNWKVRPTKVLPSRPPISTQTSVRLPQRVSHNRRSPDGR